MVASAVLEAVLRAAVDATGAAAGWVVGRDPDGLRVLAAVGVERPEDLVGTVVEAGTGTVGLVIESGQPLALGAGSQSPRSPGDLAELAGAGQGAVLCVPCGEADAIGALELAGKADSGRFSFDDVEIATLLAGIAGAAMGDSGPEPPPSPRQLARALEQLNTTDAARYAALAPIILTLLEHG